MQAFSSHATRQQRTEVGGCGGVVRSKYRQVLDDRTVKGGGPGGGEWRVGDGGLDRSIGLLSLGVLDDGFMDWMKGM